jgi:hypothetical protein
MVVGNGSNGPDGQFVGDQDRLAVSHWLLRVFKRKWNRLRIVPGMVSASFSTVKRGAAPNGLRATRSPHSAAAEANALAERDDR